MLGLKHNVNTLVDYDQNWQNEFASEHTRIAKALQNVAKGIEHYGSTAVPGMRAKPILDILVGVLPLGNWELCRTPLINLGYDYAEHAGVPGHYIFGRGHDNSDRTHLVHVVEFGGSSWTSNLAFRDALRENRALREAYVSMKQAAVAHAPDSRAKYNELKRDFIDEAKSRLP
ncbi:GrpB family protein [Mycolicibacterium aubagnense]